MKKNLFRYSLMAALVCGLSLSVTSCKDDDNDNGNGGGSTDTEVMNADETPEQLTAWRWLSFLTDVETQSEGWLKQKYEATIGVASSNSTTRRVIYVGNLTEAKENFAALAGCDPKALASDKKFDAGEYGSMEWHISAENAENIATVEVNSPLLPGLNELVYCTEEQGDDNATDITGTCYYRLGDVVEDKDGYYWVCVKPSFLGKKANDSYWVNIFNAAESGKGVNTKKTPGIPAANIYSKYNKKYNNNTIQLPTGLKLNRQQNYNLSNLVWALVNPEDYKTKVGTEGTGLCGFDYKYHGLNYLTNVAKYWTSKEVWEKLFNRNYEQMKKMKDFNLFYYGYHWKVGSTAGVWIYNSKKYESAYSGSEDDDDTLFEMKKVGYGFDIRRYASDPNADKDCASTNAGQDMAPAKQFDEQKGAYYWVVRFATGKQLDKNYDPYRNLTGFYEIYRYNAETKKLASKESETQVDNDIVVSQSTNELKNHPQDGGGSYNLGDVLVDNEGSRWFCIARRPNKTFYPNFKEDRAWFISLDNIKFNESGVAENIIDEPEAPLVAYLINDFLGCLTSQAQIPWKFGVQRNAYVNNIKLYAGIDLEDLFVVRDSTWTFKDYKGTSATFASQSSSPTYMLAFRNSDTQKQHLMRVIFDNTQAGTKRTAAPNSHEDYHSRLYKHYQYYDASKIEELDETEKKLGMTKYQKHWPVGSENIYLDDITNINIINKYAKDKWAYRDILGKNGEVIVDAPRTKAADKQTKLTTNGWNAAEYYAGPGQGLYREKVLFVRLMTIADDCSTTLNLKPLNSTLTLKPASILDNYQLFLEQTPTWSSRYSTELGVSERIKSVWLDNKLIELPEYERNK